MTGYGKSSGETELYDIEVEVKSVNHRFTDINLKLPVFLQFMDLEYRKIIKSKINRGSVSVYINLSKKTVVDNIQKINKTIVAKYVDMFKEAGDELGVASVSWDVLVQLPGVFENNVVKAGDEKTAKMISELLIDALENLSKYREKEGANLKNNLEDHLQKITDILTEVKKHANEAVKIQFTKLQEKLSVLVDVNSLNKERLEQESVLIADKVDIAEELNRLDSHLKLFKDTMEQKIPTGQKLNFLAQEMHREANTISAKTNLTEISHCSVSLREVIEKIREQVQNIE